MGVGIKRRRRRWGRKGGKESCREVDNSRWLSLLSSLAPEAAVGLSLRDPSSSKTQWTGEQLEVNPTFLSAPDHQLCGK